MNSTVGEVTFHTPRYCLGALGLTVFCFLFAAGGGAAVKKQVKPETGPLVSMALTNEAGLHQDWQIRLPVKVNDGEKTDRLFVFGPYLVVLTNQNYLSCRNCENGSFRFEMQIADKGLPVADPLYVENRIVFLIGSQLKVLDPASGAIVRNTDLGWVGENRNECVAKNEKFIYMAGVDFRIHAFEKQEKGDYVQLFTATADNDSEITSVLATNDRVYFATLTGNIVAMQADQPGKIWQYNASGPVSAPLVYENGVIYAGGLDTKLYKIDAQTGALEWDIPFFAGDKLMHRPELGKTVLYLNAGINGVYGILKDTGKEVWNVPKGEATLCESGDRAYVYARPGVLVVMNNTTGKPVRSLNFGKVTRFARNMQDAKMYVADDQGRVACISVPTNP